MAADDTKGKKRKGAPDSAPTAKKPRKADDKAPKAAPVVAKPADAKPAKEKPARKQAAEFLDNDETAARKPAAKGTKGKPAPKANGEATEPAVAELAAPKAAKKQGKKTKPVEEEEMSVVEIPQPEPNKPKKGKKAKAAPTAEDTPAAAQEEVVSKKSRKEKGGKKQDEVDDEPTEATPATKEVDGGADVEEDDQTAALLAGFESDGDSDDPEDDLNFDEDVNVPALTKSQRKALAKAEKIPKSNEPGVIYVGRVPRGFFEAQMKKYFSQFGKVNQLRLSRNKKTGASKHYAFVEFASTEVADIVARTMDNYLMFGHILKCKLVPAEQVHPDLFKGAGQRFKVDPRNKKAGLEMERGVERAQWEKRVANENKRRTGRNKQLKEDFGYEYTVPELKAVEGISKPVSTILSEETQKPLLEAPIEDVPVVEEPKGKKTKKVAKAKVDVQPIEAAQSIPEKKAKKVTKGKVTEETIGETEVVAETAEPVVAKRSKKDKKRKSDVTLEAIAPTESAPKTKKSKKDNKPDEVVANVEVNKIAAKPKKARKAKA